MKRAARIVQLHPHLTPEQLEAYVLDLLDAAEAAAVERHVLVCPACADRLARESRVELAMELLARGACASAVLAAPPTLAFASSPSAALTTTPQRGPDRHSPAHTRAQPGLRPREGAGPQRRRLPWAIGAAVTMAAATLLFVRTAPADEPRDAANAAMYAEGAGAQMAPASAHALDGG